MVVLCRHCSSEAAHNKNFGFNKPEAQIAKTVNKNNVK